MILEKHSLFISVCLLRFKWAITCVPYNYADIKHDRKLIPRLTFSILSFLKLISINH